MEVSKGDGGERGEGGKEGGDLRERTTLGWAKIFFYHS